VQHVYDDLTRKQRTTEYLRTPALMLAPPEPAGAVRPETAARRAVSLQH
jgi:hypothetical protein